MVQDKRALTLNGGRADARPPSAFRSSAVVSKINLGISLSYILLDFAILG